MVQSKTTWRKEGMAHFIIDYVSSTVTEEIKSSRGQKLLPWAANLRRHSHESDRSSCDIEHSIAPSETSAFPSLFRAAVMLTDKLELLIQAPATAI